MIAHSTAITQADDLDIVVSVACQHSILHTHKAVTVDAVIPATGNPAQLVSVHEVGVHNTGVISVGLVANTLFPVPVLAFTEIVPLLQDV